MPLRRQPLLRNLPGPCLVLLSVLLAALLCVGGASRADVLGQVAARALATLAAIAALLFAPRPKEDWPRAVVFLFLAAALLPLLQLVPLPPTVWGSLPGRALLLQADIAGQPWRPLSIEPGATVNSLGSLLVPGAVLVLSVGVRRDEAEKLVSVILALVMVSALVGLLQLSGSLVSNPLVNDTLGAVSGLFANRNHFALFLAIGCLFAPVWAARRPTQLPWRLPMALGLLMFFLLMILASGSRAGLLTGAVGTAIGGWIVRADLRGALARLPRRFRTAAVIAVPIGIIAVLSVSIALNRAQSISRALLLTGDEDMRTRAFPTVLRMIAAYMPFGTGFGTFNTAFRIHEPFGLLKLTYFNHAHDDFAEIALEGGVLALVLLAVALGWWLLTSMRAWRRGQPPLPQLGSATLLLIAIASIFDYPVRTPMMMAVVVLAGVWLARGGKPLA